MWDKVTKKMDNKQPNCKNIDVCHNKEDEINYAEGRK